MSNFWDEDDENWEDDEEWEHFDGSWEEKYDPPFIPYGYADELDDRSDDDYDG